MPDPDFFERKTGSGEPKYVEPRRRSIRLPGFDYSTPGAYFVTICARRCSSVLHDNSDVVAACWTEIPQHFQHVTLDVCVIMPDHFHGIVILGDEGAPLSVVIGSFRAA